jgi:hypothetical protein
MGHDTPQDTSAHSRRQVQTALAEAYFAQRSDTELKDLRSGLAQQLDLTAAQVTAFGAWPIIHAKKILDRHGLESVITPRVLVAIEHSLSSRLQGSSFDPATVSEQLEVFGISHVDVDTINTCLRSLSEALHRNELAAFEPKPKTESESVETQQTMTQNEVAPEPIWAVENDSTPELQRMNYDFPSKNLWRQKWIEFIDRNLPHHERPQARVLCMPSVDCERELSLYTGLGINPSNIVAVEYDKSVWNEFSARVSACGARPIFGDLKDLAPKFQQEFKVIALDFMGQYSYKTLEILTQLPACSRAILMANHRCARESREIQGQIFIDAALASEDRAVQINHLTQTDGLSRDTLASYLVGETESLERLAGGDFSQVCDPLTAARRFISTGVLHNLGRFRRDRLVYPELLDKLWLSSSLPDGSKCSRIYGDIKSIHDSLLLFVLQTATTVKFPNWAFLPALVSCTAFRLPLPKVSESWEYKTSGTSRHTFLSQFVVVDRPIDTYKRWDNAVKPVLDLVLSVTPNTETPRTTEVELTLATIGKKYRRVNVNNMSGYIESSPRELHVGFEGKTFVLSILALKRASHEFEDLIRKYPGMDKPIDPRSIEAELNAPR